MHMGRNCHRHLWLLSGTGDGAPLAEKLLQRGWKVSVSVVSYQASLKYAHLSLESLWIGALDGCEEIELIINNSRLIHDGFDYVIDATHPFAEIISSNLKTVCNILEQPLLRYERFVETSPKVHLIKSTQELLNFDLCGQKILFYFWSVLMFPKKFVKQNKTTRP